MTNSLFSKAGLSLERLRTFATIAEASGISNAAPGDANRQSQYSRQLKELEEFFGTELQRRKRGRFELTSAGRDLFQIVQSHFKAMEDLAQRCADQNVEVSVGGGESFLQWLLLPGFAEFRAKHPSITLVLQNLRTEETVNRLVDGRVDLGLLRLDAVRSPLKSARLGLIEYCLVLPRKPSTGTPEATVWGALSQRPVAVLFGSKITEAFEGEAEKKGVRLNVCLRGTSYAQLIDAIKEVRCAAVLPEFAARSLEANNDIFPLPALKDFKRPMAIAWNPRSRALRSSVASVIESLTGILRRKLSSTG